MRTVAIAVFAFILITSCSKSAPKRMNFAELKVDSLTFVFDSLSAEFDTTYYGTICVFMAYDRASGSRLTWTANNSSKQWFNGEYKYTRFYGLDRSLNSFYLGGYVIRYPKYYLLEVTNSLTMTVEQSQNGRIHGTFEGTLTCNSCTPYGKQVTIDKAEFEMPYTFLKQ